MSPKEVALHDTLAAVRKKLKSASMCHASVVQTLIDEAVALIDEATLTKVCKHCSKRLPTTSFTVTRWGTLASWCQSCTNAAGRLSWRKRQARKNPDKCGEDYLTTDRN